MYFFAFSKKVCCGKVPPSAEWQPRSSEMKCFNKFMWRFCRFCLFKEPLSSSERWRSQHPFRSLRTCPCSWRTTTKSLRLVWAAAQSHFLAAHVDQFPLQFSPFETLCCFPVVAAAAGSDSRLWRAAGGHREPLCRLLREQALPDAQREAHAAQSECACPLKAHSRSIAGGCGRLSHTVSSPGDGVWIVPHGWKQQQHLQAGCQEEN